MTRFVAVGSGVTVGVGVMVAVAVGGGIGTDKKVPGMSLLDCRQLASCNLSGLVPYLCAIFSIVSPGSTSICVQPIGMGQ